MPTVNGDFQNQADVVQTEEFGFKVTLPQVTANQVLTIDEDTAAAPEDGAVVAVDTDAAGGDVVLTIEAIPPGARVEVINLGTGGQVDLAAGDGVTLWPGSAAGTSLPATEYALAELTHYKDGNVALSGDLEADA
jgi:hypothetical protein